MQEKSGGDSGSGMIKNIFNIILSLLISKNIAESSQEINLNSRV